MPTLSLYACSGPRKGAIIFLLENIVLKRFSQDFFFFSDPKQDRIRSALIYMFQGSAIKICGPGSKFIEINRIFFQARADFGL